MKPAVSTFLRRAALAATTLAMTMTGAEAASVTWQFTGTVTGVFTGGIYSGLVSFGDTYTLKYSFDDAQTPDLNLPFLRRWNSGSVSEVSINGMTFALGESSSGTDERQAVLNQSNGNDLEQFGDVRQDFTTGSGGNATSSVSSVSHVQMSWYLLDMPAYTQLSSFPVFPSAIVLNDWVDRHFTFQAQGPGQGDLLSFGQLATAFSTWEVVNAPTPGTLALLGLGLLGLGATRRRAV